MNIISYLSSRKCSSVGSYQKQFVQESEFEPRILHLSTLNVCEPSHYTTW